MRVSCPNCKTAHEITDSQINRDYASVIICANCGKKIKFQFCPHCNAFYSITFSNIKSGNYTYQCKRCYNKFTIKISDDEKAGPISNRPQTHYNQQSRPIEKNEKINNTSEKIIFANKQNAPERTRGKNIYENKVHEKPKDAGAETFSISELFRYAYEAFTLKKIIVSAMGITFMLAFLLILNSIMNFATATESDTTIIASSVMNILPIAVIFSFYILSASLVAKITLNHIVHSRSTGTGEIIKFAIKKGPGIIGINIILLFVISSLLIIFGKIPLLGPIFFSLAFLPIYLLSMAVLILSFIGLWFYPPIAAHDESGVFKNIKSLLLFIKRHNFSIILMIPVIFLITLVIFAAIFIIHISVFSFTTAISQLLIGQDVLMTLASIPGQFIKASQAALAGMNSGIYKELHQSLELSHHIAGFILGIIFLLMTIFLLSIPISVASTVSAHIYVLMERKNSIADKIKVSVLPVLVILILLVILMILIKKIV